MKKILLLILALSMCFGCVACNGKEVPPSEETTASTTDASGEDNELNKTIMLACSFDTPSYEIADLIDGSDHVVTKNGETLEGTNVKLSVGTNVFDVVYKVSGIERTAQVRIARRANYRVVFNTNGGSFIDNQYVTEGTKIDDATVIPTRERYTFVGWYNEKGKKVTLKNTPIMQDTTLIAHWEGPNSFAVPDDTPIKYYTSSAALNINWQDYDNAFGTRPTEVRCTLTNLANTTKKYTVKVTKDSASFVGMAPSGATISQGAGNWTVKITGLPFAASYTFVMNDLGSEDYTTIQSGTTVYNTIKGYEPSRDESATLRTENGHFYDVAGNVVVLKGFTTVNVNDSNFRQNTSTLTLRRLRDEGINCLRITMPLGNNAGWRAEALRSGYISNMKGAIERATALGIYIIVDWGVMMKGGDGYIGKDKTDSEGNVIPNYNYFEDWLPDATEFFTLMSSTYADNPYVIYELANEPAVANSSTAWETYLRPWYTSLINTIRGNDVDAVILAAPNMHARRISDVDKANGSDPIDKPFSTEISYNIGYTFHCYSYTTTYDSIYAYYTNQSGEKIRQSSRYGHIMSDAIKNGLTMVITEFCPTDASLTSEYGVDDQGLNYDLAEFEKWIKIVLENDVSYTMLRYDTPTTARMTDGQFPLIQGFLFIPECDTAVYNGTWTYDMLSFMGQYCYNNVFHSTGFIKGTLFTPDKTTTTK